MFGLKKKKEEIIDLTTLKENETIIDKTKYIYYDIKEVKQNFVFKWFKKFFLCKKHKLLVAINYPTIVRFFLVNIKKGYVKIKNRGYHIQEEKMKPTNSKFKIAFYDYDNPNPQDLIHKWISGISNTNGEQLNMYMEAELVSKALRAKRKMSVMVLVLIIVGVVVLLGIVLYIMYTNGMFTTTPKQ
jgi:hypothetical protein